MKKLLTAILLSAILASSLTACGTRTDKLARALGVDVSKGEEISNFDDHGGFHGDGTTCIAYRFDDDAVLEKIKDSSSWSEFPLDDTVRVLLGGISDAEGNTLVPEIENGYYRLVDRQKDTEKDILERYSYNFTLGLYDTDTDTLYLCALDT